MKKNETKSASNVVTIEPKKNTAKIPKKTAEPTLAPSTIQPKTAVLASLQAAPKAKPKTITKNPDQTASEAFTLTATETLKKKSTRPKTTKKTPVVNSDSSAQSTEMSVYARIGLTAGAIWHYLADNGPRPVDKLIKSLSEESTIIQRSIGWLAQENKITLTLVDGIETIALTE
jgi:hypothetical protein